jgi:hypothetical protein
MNKSTFVWLAAALLVVVVFFTCNDGSSDIETALAEEVVNTVQLKVSPERAAIAKGGEQQFMDLLNGKETTAAEWNV